MGDGHWKLSVDQQGVTIVSDHFQLTTNGSAISTDPAAGVDVAIDQFNKIEGILSELEGITRRPYGQYCGLARAMELVGGRWTLLILRDLSVRPKTAAELRHGLPKINEDILSTRLRELEHAGIVRQRPMPDDSVGYELTEYGQELEDILLRFSHWGAMSLGDPRPEEIVTTDSLVTAMRSVFDPGAARDVNASYEIRVGDDIVFHIRVNHGHAHVGPGPLPDADVVLEPGVALKALMAGELSVADAITHGEVKIVGDPALLSRFTEMFSIPRRPAESIATS